MASSSAVAVLALIVAALVAVAVSQPPKMDEKCVHCIQIVGGLYVHFLHLIAIV